jgi:hypothetical protein
MQNDIRTIKRNGNKNKLADTKKICVPAIGYNSQMAPPGQGLTASAQAQTSNEEPQTSKAFATNYSHTLLHHPVILLYGFTGCSIGKRQAP